jgi:hypothetical protein
MGMKKAVSVSLVLMLRPFAFSEPVHVQADEGAQAPEAA